MSTEVTCRPVSTFRSTASLTSLSPDAARTAFGPPNRQATDSTFNHLRSCRVVPSSRTRVRASFRPNLPSPPGGTRTSCTLLPFRRAATSRSSPMSALHCTAHSMETGPAPSTTLKAAGVLLPRRSTVPGQFLRQRGSLGGDGIWKGCRPGALPVGSAAAGCSHRGQRHPDELRALWPESSQRLDLQRHHDRTVAVPRPRYRSDLVQNCRGANPSRRSQCSV
jgi:hypothetical protein